MENLISQIQNELKKHLDYTESRRGTVTAVYLFGSRAAPNHRGETSDLDLAFLLDSKVYGADPVTAVSPAYIAASNLGVALGLETDVTILNAASLEMAYEIITTGRCLLDNDPDKRMDYEIVLRGMYFDFKPFLERLRAGCASRL